MPARHFLSAGDLQAEELRAVIDAACAARADPGKLDGALAGKQVALLFEKPSTRTRISFEAAVNALGGHALVLRAEEMQLERGETLEDTGRVLARYVDAVVLRTFEQDRLERLATAAAVPVINALSDREHPCQALADLQTIREHRGELSGVKLGYFGDGNNVAHSLMLAGALAGMDVRVASPPGYEPDPEIAERARRLAASTGSRITVTELVAEAAEDADVVYTDVWASMGQESEAQVRSRALRHYQVNAQLVGLARQDCIVMHCLPAHRGEEITADVLDGPRSVVWDQAENRLHSQKALLAHLLG